VPFTGFLERWRRRLQPQYQDPAPALRETEKLRDAATRKAAEELAAIVATPSPALTTKPEDNSRS
jgi:hypothetical protein